MTTAEPPEVTDIDVDKVDDGLHITLGGETYFLTEWNARGLMTAVVAVLCDDPHEYGELGADSALMEITSGDETLGVDGTDDALEIAYSLILMSGDVDQIPLEVA